MEVGVNVAEQKMRNGRLYDVVQQRRGDFVTAVDEDLLHAKEQGNIRFVYQRGIGFVDGNDPQTRFVETSDFGSEVPGFGSCGVVVGWSPESKRTCVVHADTLTDLESAREMIEQKYGDEEIEISVVGGQEQVSEGTLDKISTTFGGNSKWKLKRVDILGPKYGIGRQVVVDGSDGRVYNLQSDARTSLKPWTVDMPSEIELRSRKAAMITPSLIVDVNSFTAST